MPIGPRPEDVTRIRRTVSVYKVSSIITGTFLLLLVVMMVFRYGFGVDIEFLGPYGFLALTPKDLIAGTLQAMTASIPAALPLAADKRVRVLAVTGPKRIPQMPDVPSWQEQGVANAEVINYWGIVAPAGTPRDAIAKLNAETRRVLAQADVRERLEREGAELIPGEPERLGVLIASDLANWKKLIAEARLTFE